MIKILELIEEPMVSHRAHGASSRVRVVLVNLKWLTQVHMLWNRPEATLQ